MARIGCIFSTLLLCSCVYVPPLWDVADAIHRLDRIEPGVTTEAEVIAWFGEPEVRDGSSITYTGKDSEGLICWAASIYVGDCALVDEDLWIVTIFLDELGIVDEVKTLSPRNAAREFERREAESREEQNTQVALAQQERIESMASLQGAAEAGDPQAQYALAALTTHRVQRWTWLCRAAHAGHAQAQHLMAAGRRAGIPGRIERDELAAYVWYGLAAANGESRAKDSQRSLAESMNEQSRGQAESMLAAWRPEPEACMP